MPEENQPSSPAPAQPEPAPAVPVVPPTSEEPDDAEPAVPQANEKDLKPQDSESLKPQVSEEDLTRTVEALLFAAEEPLPPREIARAAGSDSAAVRKILKALKETYEQRRQPWELVEVANGYRLVTRAEFYPAIQRLKTQTAQRKLTQAALETLALIAYRQPISRAEIESARGVGAGPVLRLLLEKKLVRIAGRGQSLGQPLLYGTADYFLEHFGLRNIQDLPKPGEFKDSTAN